MNTENACPPIYVISGGNGASGNLLLQTVLAQFEHGDPPIQTMAMVDNDHEAETLVAQAKKANALIVHTLVNPQVR